jgi:hypothetical protein
MGSYWKRVTTLVCNIVETCSVLAKLSNAEPVICMRDVGKDSFVRSMEIGRDEVYSRILQEMSTMDNFISRKKAEHLTMK